MSTIVADDPDGPDARSDADVAATTSPDIELPEHLQRRNSLVFLLSYAVAYFFAPVLYVGVLHAAVVHSLGYKDSIANLPESVFICMLPVPMVIAWIWPSSRYLKRVLVSSFIFKGLAGLLAAALFAFAPESWRMVGLVVHGAVIGGMNGTTNMCLWELIGRGTAPARRSWTLGFAFGFGPIFAVLGSCVSQLILSGNFLDTIHTHPVPKPWSYVLLFGASGPAMLASAACVFLAQVPAKSVDEPKASVAGVVQGVREYFTHRLIVIAACGFLLTAAGGNMIFPNLGMYARVAIGEPPENYSGVQLAIRFGFKSLFGFALAWLLAKARPKAPALATTLICLAGIAWALLVPGKWYLLSFGLLGAGELYYVYYLNYIVGCSAPHRIRENIAYTNVLSAAVGFMPFVYGLISMHYGVNGLRASFFVAGGILIVATAVVSVFLPRQPPPYVAPVAVKGFPVAG